MDLSVPNKTTSGEEYAGPARDEANAPSEVKSREAAGSDAVDDREAEAGPGAMRRPLRADHTVQPYTTCRSNRAPITCVGTAEDSSVAGTLPNSEYVEATAFPNPVTPVADESMQCPEREHTQTIGNRSRRQIRRENAKQRKRMSQHHMSLPSVNEHEAGSSGRKRTLTVSADSSQSCTEVKRAKVEAQAEPSTEKVAIIPVTFPAEQILQTHIAAIQEAIMTHLVDAPDPLPHVAFGSLVGGALYFNCAGRDSVNWLSATISEGEIAGLSLKVVDAKDLPKPVKMAWKTKIVGVQDIKLLLKVLQRYNPSLHTDQWKVVDTSMDTNSSRRIILMDRASADVIRNAGYQLHSGIDISTFKVLEDTERAPKSATWKDVGSWDSLQGPGDPI